MLALTDRRLLVLLLAGISSGLPALLVGRCLKAWMTADGQTDTAIGMAGLVALPYSLKVLWAPVLDRVAPPGGRRRGWLGLCSVALCLALAVMSRGSPAGDLPSLWVIAAVVAFLSATQDMAVDALRVESLPAEAQPAGAAAGILGYRIALILTGGLGFILADRISWPTTYLLLAGVQLVGLLAAFLAREQAAPPPVTTWTASVVEPLRDFLGRQGLLRVVLVLAFAVLYKFGDSLAASLATPFLLRSGYTAADLGWAEGTVGLAATCTGIVLGGTILARWSLPVCLAGFGAAMSLSNLAYAALAQWGGGMAGLMAVLATEHFAAGLAVPCFVAFLSRECNPVFAATQYALLSCLMAAGRDGLASLGGVGKEWLHLGWPAYFTLSALAGLPGLLLLIPLRTPQRSGSTTVPSV